MQTMASAEEKMVQAARTLPRPIKGVITHTASFLCGLLLSSVRLGEAAPFGVSFLAAVPVRYLFSAGAGAAAGSILTLDSVSALRYIAALLSAGVLVRLSREFERLRDLRLLPACIAFLVCFLTGAAAAAATGFSLAVFASVLGEAAASFGAAWSFSAAMAAGDRLFTRAALETRLLPGVCVTAFLLLLSVADAALFGVSPARIAAVYLLLLCAWLFRETGGATAGLAAACVFLLDGDLGIAAIAYGAAGLAAGVVMREKRINGTAALLCAYAAGLLLTNGGWQQALEALLAAGLFLATPARILHAAQRVVSETVGSAQDNPQRREILSRLSGAVHAVDEMAQSVKSVSAMLEVPVTGQSGAVTARVHEEVCTACGRHALCWEHHRDETLRDFAAVYQMLASGETLSAQRLPAALLSKCIRQTSLCESFARQYIRATERGAAQVKINEVRQVTAEQFDSLCDMLRDFSAELSTELCFDETAAQRAKDCLRTRFGIIPQDIDCICSEADRLRLRITFADAVKTPPQNELREALEEAIGRPLEPPCLQAGEQELQVTFCERTEFCVEAGAARRAADSEHRCGDSYESFYDGRGGYVAVLSDGMGQGTRAAVDSTLAVALFTKLCKAGVQFHSALRLVNAALMLKSAEESLATLDVLRIDLYSGKAEFYKAGAAKSLLLRGNACREIKRASLPAGILKEARFAVAEGKLLDGDIAVLASDGAFDADEGALRRALPALREKPCDKIAERLLEIALQKKMPHRDDITVLVLRMRKNPRGS